MTVSFEGHGDFRKTESWLDSLRRNDIRSVLEGAGQEGVKALAANTPSDSGLAANSWKYSITGGRSGYTITWSNYNVEGGFPVAIMLQYGYGTGTGGYVAGRDYINPAMRPIFDKIAERIWKVVKSA